MGLGLGVTTCLFIPPWSCIHGCTIVTDPDPYHTYLLYYLYRRLNAISELYLPPLSLQRSQNVMPLSAKLNTLPIIDIAPFLQSGNQEARETTAKAIHQACLDYGFFYLKIDSYVDPSEPEELTRLAREFFASPQEEKDKIALKNQDNARGRSILVMSMQPDDATTVMAIIPLL